MPREHHSWTAQELASWANKGLIWRKGLSRWPYYTSWCCPTGAIHICGSLLQLTGSVVLQKWTFLYLKFHSPNLYCSHVKAHSTYQWCTLEGRIPFTVLSHVPVIPVKWDRSTDFIWSEFCTSYLTFLLFQKKKKSLGTCEACITNKHQFPLPQLLAASRFFHQVLPSSGPAENRHVKLMLD